MTFSLTQLLMLGVGYLMLLFVVAYVSESGLIPIRWLRHPALYVLSLGVYVSVWGLFGVVGFAHQLGFNFLAFYLGISGAFLLAPVLLAPILKLTKTYQLGSLADLYAYRYRSQLVGSVVTLAMIVGMLPLLAAQIQAVADAVHILTRLNQPNLLALVFCLVIMAFTMLYGARHISPREKHEGLVVAIALESVIKLVVLLAVGAYALWGVFDGPADLGRWLDGNPDVLQQLYEPLQNGPWHTFVLTFLFAAVLMPYMYQMAFTENFQGRHLMTASWGLPLYLFLMSLPVPVLLWAGMKLDLGDLHPEYFTLGVALASNNALLPLMLFVGGLSAASGIIIVSTLALSSMTLNHLILPIYQPPPEHNIYTWLLWVRRTLIIVLILLAYGFFVLLDERYTLTDQAMLTFVATLQFAPGLLGVLFWPRGNRTGFLVGLGVGMALWFILLLGPYLVDLRPFRVLILPYLHLDLDLITSAHYWQAAGMGAILLNTLCYVTVSLLTPQSESERIAADTCSVDNLRRPMRRELSISGSAEVIERLTVPLGQRAAEREVRLALDSLGMAEDDSRPYSLRRLRDQIESNLSGLLGPSMAQDLVDQCLPYKVRPEQRPGEDIHYIESRLEDYRHQLSGLAAELDSLRRFHRQTLYDLPIGVCSLGKDLEILSWNHAMAELTGITDETIIGSTVQALPQPWRELLAQFVRGVDTHVYRQQIMVGGLPRWVSMNRALIGESEELGHGDTQVIVIEDLTELHMLESRLTHSERLAAIGRLAAGVAHEIGNPVTGIACLAQNLKAESYDPEVSDASQQILAQTQRISRIVQSLVGFARADNHSSDRREPVNIRACADEAIHLLLLAPGGKEYDFRNDSADDAIASGDTQRLTQVFINLLSNARDASPPGSRIVVRAQQHEHSVKIEVEDSGSGLPEQVRTSLFEPFVTTKETGKGTGLGLALVHGIIEEHYGRIQLVDKADYDQGQGVIVYITLPAWKDSGNELL